MAKTIKKAKDKVAGSKKTVGIFDFINGMSRDKIDWNSYTEAEQKAFQPFMINRWLGMNLELTELVNVFQQYTIGILEPKEVYTLYSGVLPRQSIYLKYIKGKKDDKYNPELLDFMKLYYNVGKTEIKEYLDIMLSSPNGIEEIINILQKYGLDEKKIKKLLKD